MEYMICTTDELRHHGTKGMRWGIRRWQNKDGSLTPAGQKRRAKLEAKLEKVTGKKKGSDVGDQPRRKTASEMTDDELDKAINRARKEDEYRRLRPEPQPKEKFSKRFFNDAIKPAAVNAGKQFLENALKKAGENLFKTKIDPNSIEGMKKTIDKMELTEKLNATRRRFADKEYAQLELESQKAKMRKSIRDDNAEKEDTTSIVKQLMDLSPEGRQELRDIAADMFYYNAISSGKGAKPDKGQDKKKDDD
jgi:hypothetical protein